MIVASCPSCREDVTVPIDARPSSIVRCPLCNAECRLEEFLAQLPPPLIVLADTDAGADEATARSASAAHDTATEHDMALDIGRPLEPDEQLPAFDFTPAFPEDAAAEPREIVRRPARRQTNAAWEVAKIVGGALLAVPAAQIILWWCVPYSWKRDLLGIGPPVSRVAPWVVPAKFRAALDEGSLEPANTANDDNAAVALQRRSRSTSRKWQSKLPEPGAGRTGFDTAEGDSPPAVDLTGNTSSDQPATAADLDAPQPTSPPTMPTAEPTDDSANGTPPKAVLSGERRSTNEPGATAPGTLGNPPYSVADLQVALERALQASVAWDTSPDQAQQQRAGLTEEFYSAFAHLGEMLAFMSPGESSARELAAAVRDLLLSFERQPKKLAMIGNRTSEWLDQPARPNQGVFLFGTVGQIQPQGSLFATELELASLKQRTVSIVSRIDPKGFYAPGDRILMLGALIGDPVKNLPGYKGGAAVVVLGSFPIRLP
jgi:hypothetical protein